MQGVAREPFLCLGIVVTKVAKLYKKIVYFHTSNTEKRRSSGKGRCNKHMNMWMPPGIISKGIDDHFHGRSNYISCLHS